jgi:tetratricopeptide (TPR) repeat protein
MPIYAAAPHMNVAVVSARALLERATQLHAAGRLDEAEALYRRVLEIGRRNTTALRGFALIAEQAGRHDEALACFSKLARMAPGAEAQADLGRILLILGRSDEALRAFQKALVLNPSHLPSLLNGAATLLALGRTVEALARLDQALRLDPDNVDALSNRALALIGIDRCEEALLSLDRRLSRHGPSASALATRGQALARLGRHAEALESFEAALALTPDAAALHDEVGRTLFALGRFDEAIAAFDRAVALAPDLAGAHTDRARVLHHVGRGAEALRGHARAVALAPDLAVAHYNLGLCCLQQGDLARGFAEYEWRWPVAEAELRRRRRFVQPLWLGTEDVAGKTIFLHAEQGLGDTLQFCRYAPMVAARGARVILEVQKPLQPLMAGLAGVAEVIAAGDPTPPFDLQCPLMSLPLAFKTELASVPAPVPYLAADPARLDTWVRRLGPRSRPRVGLVWSGNSGYSNDRLRSIALADLVPLLDDRVEWISLQKEVRPADAATLAARQDIHPLGSDLGDFADTAAVVALVDLVVSVDTGVAHLAGAMGKPVWILLPFSPDWRWLLGRDDSPWYPSVHLFRQPAFGDWAGAIAELRQRIVAWIGAQERGKPDRTDMDGHAGSTRRGQ